MDSPLSRFPALEEGEIPPSPVCGVSEENPERGSTDCSVQQQDIVNEDSSDSDCLIVSPAHVSKENPERGSTDSAQQESSDSDRLVVDVEDVITPHHIERPRESPPSPPHSSILANALLSTPRVKRPQNGSGDGSSESSSLRAKKRRSDQLQRDSIGFLWEEADWAFFVEINFLLSAYKAKYHDCNDLWTPLTMTRLRPKEVSVVRVSGQPYHHHWVINYNNREDGCQKKMENTYYSPLRHGMTWKTVDGEAIDRFDRFLGGLKQLVFRYENFEAKLYTSDPAVKYFLENVCKFTKVILLKPEKKIDFDPWIHHCQHHPGVEKSSRPCTENRVWALRHHFGKTLSFQW